MWKVRNLYRTGLLKTVSRELGKCTLDLVGVQERGGRRRLLKGQRIVHSSMEEGIRDRFFVHKRIISAVRRVQFIGD
jgi:hypothetical protein